MQLMETKINEAPSYNLTNDSMISLSEQARNFVNTEVGKKISVLEGHFNGMSN